MILYYLYRILKKVTLINFIMQKSSLFFIVMAIVFFTNCKKEYACECTNPGGKYIAFYKNGTKAKAEQKCKN